MSRGAAPGPRVRPGARLAAGAAGMALGLLVIYAAGAFLHAIPYPPARLAALLVALVPGDVATASIERLGHWAMRALAAGVHLGALALGGWLALMAGRAHTPGRTARRVLAAGAALLGAALLLGLTGEGISVFAPVAYLAGAAVYARLAAGVPVLRTALRPEARPGEMPLDAIQRSRRRFLVRTAAAVGGGVVGGAATLRFLTGKLPVVVAIAPADLPFVPPPPDPAFPAVTGLSPEVTPNRDFYVVDINFVKPRIDHERWRLQVAGLVERPYELTWSELQERFEVVEVAHTLTCISNQVGGDLVSTTVWRGVRLKDVLERAGLREGAVDVVFRGAEGYTDSVPVAKALEETTLVAFGMNGAALPREHGFPARVVLPGIYGMKNVKWLVGVEAVDHDYRGYWMKRGWSDVARVKTQSRIDVPHTSEVRLPARVAGVAWAGDRGVAGVEVSEDGGQTWRPALLKRELAPLAWRLWAVDLSPGRGRRRLVVRATDGAGEVQTAVGTRPHPDGASGRHEIAVEVG